jgi:hypothetical protein
MDYTQIIITIITAIVVPGTVWLIKKVDAYLSLKIMDEQLQKYLSIASECIIDAVKSTAQTFVDHIDDKDWNDQTKREAFELARITALENLGLTGRTLIEEALGDFDAWVDTKIEAEVKRQAVSMNG